MEILLASARIDVSSPDSFRAPERQSLKYIRSLLGDTKEIYVRSTLCRVSFWRWHCRAIARAVTHHGSRS